MDAINRICCYGATRLGVLTVLIIARHWNQVNDQVTLTVVDDEQVSINWLTSPNLIHKEDDQDVGLQELLDLMRGQNVYFSNNIEQEIDQAQMIFLFIEKESNTQLEGMMVKDGVYHYKKNPDAPIDPDHLIRSLYQGTNHQHTIILNPMIPSYGRLIDDLIRPNAVIIAPKSPNADVGALVELYHGWNSNEGTIISNYTSRDVEFATLVHDVIFGLQEVALSLVRALVDEAEIDNDNVMAIANIDSRLFPAPNLRSPIAAGPEILKNLSYFAELATEAKDARDGMHAGDRFFFDFSCSRIFDYNEIITALGFFTYVAGC
ncbi:hypothetical protein COLO4_12092 [Corchorus olitorius]|uniref:Uncharacterized protein n=1 Tax=Corchorus olitorius TaxID=93759 RepID=A0A1R3K284_9ROSI|nr:hypothetical protein COLO4_12092 [Corchorus olitorius]